VGELDAKENFELDDNQLGAECEYITTKILSFIESNWLTSFLDNFEQLEGAPCSIQLFTTTMRDEECLQIAKQIDQCLKSKK
jgi:hypothetical protein